MIVWKMLKKKYILEIFFIEIKSCEVIDMSYQHKVDKDKIPVCNIMGVNIAAINMNWLIKFTIDNIKSLSGDYMCVSNVHTTVTAYEDKTYCKIQNGGIMAIPDGGPLSLIGRKRGWKSMLRITGPEYMEKVFQISKENGYRHFFYGSTDETLAKIRDSIATKYPDLEIIGMYSPPFRPMTYEEDLQVITDINAVKPDFIWVGLGAPKQEIWMANHQGKVHGFMVGVGAAFDYMAGNIKRAPKWMQRYSLEWLYRMCQEPKRLFMRYLITNSKFIWYTLVKNNA